MKAIRGKRYIRLAGLALGIALGTIRAKDDLAGSFVMPPDAAKPWVNMFWIGRITPADKVKTVVR